MRPERITQFNKRYFVFVITIALFTSIAFCADPNSKSASAKSQVKKQSQKQTAQVTKPRPTMSPSSFTPDMPLREAIEILRNSTVPPLNISVLWKDLEENADITQDTPIGINGVTGVTLKTHLNLLLAALSAGGLAELGFTVDSGVIIIATKKSLSKKLVSRTYDIADIVAPPSGTTMGMGMGMGMMPYGNMSPYGTMMPYGMNGSLNGLNQYINPGYLNQGYLNQGMNQGYMNQGYLNQNYLNQGYSPYSSVGSPYSVGMRPLM